MEDLYIADTGFTPKIDFKFSDNSLTVEGRSLPEDVREFYGPVFDWLQEFITVVTNPIDVSFKLDYFNTASAKIIVDILFKLDTAKKKGVPVKITWYYEEYDEDMKEVGQRFNEITGMEINIIATH